MTPFILAFALATAPTVLPVPARQLTTTGQAQVSFTPNQAIVSFQVPATGRDAATAKKASDEKARKVLAACAAIDAKNVTQNEGQPNPEYRGNEIISYSVLRTLVVTFTDLPKAGEVIASMLKAGAVVAGSVQLSNSDHNTFETKARLLASVNAKERATGMVEALGAKLGLPRTVTESTSNTSTVYGTIATSADGQVTTNFGQVSMVAQSNVNVIFDIQDQ